MLGFGSGRGRILEGDEMDERMSEGHPRYFSAFFV